MFREGQHGSVSLAYDRSGSGEPGVVLLHGWLCDRGDMAGLHQSLAAHHEVISADLRSHGESPSTPEGHALSDLAQDVGELCAALDLGPVVLVGHSLGGAVAIEVACMYPERVSGVALVDSPWAVVPPEPSVVAAASPGAALEFDVRLANIWKARQAAGYSGEGPGTTPEAAGLAVYASLMEWPGPARLRECPVPVLGVFGDSSWMKVCDALAQFDRVEAVHVAGAGHWVQLDAPSVVSEAVQSFISTTIVGSSKRNQAVRG